LALQHPTGYQGELKKQDYQGYRVAEGIRPETGRTTQADLSSDLLPLACFSRTGPIDPMTRRW